MKEALPAFLVLFLVSCEGLLIPGEMDDLISFTTDSDVQRNVSELISSKGYPVEEHSVQTADGYILSLQRIPPGRDSDTTQNRKGAVLLVHGIFDCADNWVINFPNQSLGFILADVGYDVWLGNTRGNIYSRKHVKYSPDDPVDKPKFWDFSFEEIGKFDLPAMIDYILNATKEEKLYYVGYSQGSTAAFALLSQSPEYNEKIKLFVAIAPVAWFGHATWLPKLMSNFVHLEKFVLESLGQYELMPRTTLSSTVGKYVCETPAKVFCQEFMYLFLGMSREHLNQTRLGVYVAHYPSGSSTKSLAHFGQMIKSKHFRKYDYELKNIEVYGQAAPPDYDVSRITTPTAVIHSSNDALSLTEDVQILESHMTSLVSSYLVTDPSYGHFDYLIAIDAATLVYPNVLSLLNQY